ncbi:hypothetical protein DACRYDRAFT_45575, partial [Dacryopinax primogenitus]
IIQLHYSTSTDVMSCAVTDSVAISRPCCAIHNYPLPLPSSHASFCIPHTHLKYVCIFPGCNAPTQLDMQTCDLEEHTAQETAYCTVGNSYALL